MKPLFEMDIQGFTKALNRYRLPYEKILKTAEVALSDAIEKKARAKLGTGQFGTMIAEGIQHEVTGDTVHVAFKESASLNGKAYKINRIAEHVEKGGPIKSGNGKKLAIPIHRSVKGLWASDVPGLVPLPTPKAFYLGQPSGKKGKVKPLFIVVDHTKPQKPRPFFPTPQEIQTILDKEKEEWVKKMPQVIE